MIIQNIEGKFELFCLTKLLQFWMRLGSVKQISVNVLFISMKIGLYEK